MIVAALVAASFVLGLVRPWDWLGGGLLPSADRGPSVSAGPGIPRQGASFDPGATAPAAPRVEPVCAYPASWRVAADLDWLGHKARTWTATTAVTASGPEDPSVAFEPEVSSQVTAIGWCAPISGPDRPPLSAVGTLFRLDGSGGAAVVPFDRLEPASRDALGELWMPVPRSAGLRPPWRSGRYVIRLATPDGSYARYIGIEVVITGQPSQSPSDDPAPSTNASPSPAG